MYKYIISLFLGVLASYLAVPIVEKYSPDELFTFILKVDIEVYAYILMATIFFGVFFLLYPTIKSYFDIVYFGRFRGLWSNGRLSKVIRKNYERSSIIKIKVTRGFNLFAKEGGIYHDLIFNESFNKEKKVEILLHYPCLKSEHITKRSKANQKSIDSYVKDMFLVLKAFKEHTEKDETDEKIEVRFYTDKYVDWRYYIFIRPNRNKNILFNHYDKSIPGASSKMFNVFSGKGSLCDYMETKFDEIFDHDSVELVNNITYRNDLKNSIYCGHPACGNMIKKTYSEVFKK